MQIQKTNFAPRKVLVGEKKIEARWNLFLFILIIGFCLYQLSSLTQSEKIHCYETTKIKSLCTK